MKLMLILLLLTGGPSVFARDPGTGSNTTVGTGVPTPDSGSEDTSIMRGGTPGGTESEDKQLQEERKETLQNETSKKDITDQNSDSDSL